MVVHRAVRLDCMQRRRAVHRDGKGFGVGESWDHGRADKVDGRFTPIAIVLGTGAVGMNTQLGTVLLHDVDHRDTIPTGIVRHPQSQVVIEIRSGRGAAAFDGRVRNPRVTRAGVHATFRCRHIHGPAVRGDHRATIRPGGTAHPGGAAGSRATARPGGTARAGPPPVRSHHPSQGHRPSRERRPPQPCRPCQQRRPSRRPKRRYPRRCLARLRPCPNDRPV